MITLTTSVDMALFDRAALRFVQELGLSWPRVVRVTARQLDEELLRNTPPKTQAQGRAAVKRDIGRAMWLLDPDKIHNKVLAQAVRDQEFDVVKAFMNQLRGKGGFLSNYRLEHFSPSLHTTARDRRGRVTRSQHIVVLERSEYNRYVREMQGHVGATKYGWGVAGRKLGASIPNWILRHSPALGDITEDYNPTNPSVVMTNRGPGIEALGSSFVQRSVDRRTRSMEKDVDRVVAGGISRYFS